MAAVLPSPRVMVVCQTIVVRPLCSGTARAVAVSPMRIGRRKLVLLSTVVVVLPSPAGVGEIALGRRAHADEGPGAAQAPDVVT